MSPDMLVAGVDGRVAMLDSAPGGKNGGDDPSVWTSRNGIEWRRLGNGINGATALVALPDRLIAFVPEAGVETGFAVWVGLPL